MLCAHTVRRLKEDLARRMGPHRDRREAIEPFVESVIANGVYDVAESWAPEGVATA